MFDNSADTGEGLGSISTGKTSVCVCQLKCEEKWFPDWDVNASNACYLADVWRDSALGVCVSCHLVYWASMITVSVWECMGFKEQGVKKPCNQRGARCCDKVKIIRNSVCGECSVASVKQAY